MASPSAPPPPGSGRPSQLETQRPEATPTFRRREGTTHRGFAASGTAHGLGPTRRDHGRTTAHGPPRASQLETQRPPFVPHRAPVESTPSTRLHGFATLAACALVAVLVYRQCALSAPDGEAALEPRGSSAELESSAPLEQETLDDPAERASFEPELVMEGSSSATAERAWPSVRHRAGQGRPADICQVQWLDMHARSAAAGERAQLAPLMIAAESGSLQELEQLLAAGAVVDQRDALARTALMYAARAGRDAHVTALLRAGADARTRGLWDEQGGSMSALDAALRAGALDTARLLQRDVLASFTRLEGPDLSAIDEAGDTPLHWIARYADGAAAALLISRGADLEAKNCPARPGDERGVHADDLHAATPLLVAISAGNVDVAQRLLASGADARAVDERGRSVFHVMRHPETLALTAELLRAGADPQRADQAGESPSDAVAASGLRLDFARALAAAGRPITYPPATLSDAFGAIARLSRSHDPARDDPGTLLALLESNALLASESDANGRTLLYETARQGLPRMTEALIARGADLDARDRDGRAALHVARDAQTVAALTRAGAKLDARDRGGATPLHVAAASDALGAVEALLEAGADPELRDAAGRTPLDWARASKSASVVERLER